MLQAPVSRPCTPIPSRERPPAPCPNCGDASVESAGQGGLGPGTDEPRSPKRGCSELSASVLTAGYGPDRQGSARAGLEIILFSMISRTGGGRGGGPSAMCSQGLPTPSLAGPTFHHLLSEPPAIRNSDLKGQPGTTYPSPGSSLALTQRQSEGPAPLGGMLRDPRGAPFRGGGVAYRRVQCPTAAAQPVPLGLGGQRRDPAALGGGCRAGSQRSSGHPEDSTVSEWGGWRESVSSHWGFPVGCRGSSVPYCPVP